MKLQRFKVGDWVIVKPGYQGDEGGVGVVVTVGTYTCGIDFKVQQGERHNLAECIDTRTGWFVATSYLTLAEIPYDPTQVGDTEDDI
jgi:hypothetical protein